MQIKVDQSGKIERTQRNTALALSNEIQYTVLFLAVEKRKTVTQLRQRGESGKTLYLKIFAAALFLLLEDHLDQLDEVVIDPEYPGKEAQIRELLLNHIWKVAPSFPRVRIVFRQIGKKSPAHRKALAVYRGDVKADRKIKTRDILRLLK
ncbi:MAG: hypothetical protein FJ014_17800 [Chloroflexi bacterium]|nr:hypothetical protein [Chloroflexota bacterium]